MLSLVISKHYKGSADLLATSTLPRGAYYLRLHVRFHWEAYLPHDLPAPGPRHALPLEAELLPCARVKVRVRLRVGVRIRVRVGLGLGLGLGLAPAACQGLATAACQGKDYWTGPYRTASHLERAPARGAQCRVGDVLALVTHRVHLLRRGG